MITLGVKLFVTLSDLVVECQFFQCVLTLLVVWFCPSHKLILQRDTYHKDVTTSVGFIILL